MRLGTRIAGFEWALVGLLVGTVALSIELTESTSIDAAGVIRDDYRSTETIGAMRQALWSHELSAARVRLNEGRPQELYQARTRFSLALDSARDRETGVLARQALDSLSTLTDRYFTGEVTVDAALAQVDALDDLVAKRVEAEAEAALATGRGGVHLLASIGAIAVLLALFLTAGASRNITQPLETLHRTVVALTDPANSHRRVPDGNYNETLRELGRAINRLADRVETAEREPDRQHALLVAAADRLIEQLGEPVVIVDLSGCTRLSNQAARDLLQSHSPDELGIPSAVRAALSADVEDDSADMTRLDSQRGTAVGYALRLRPPKTV